MPMPTLAAIGLGSNLDDPAAQIRRAFTELAGLSDTRLIATSQLYSSQALLSPGDTAPQPDYCNAVALIETTLDPQNLLEQLRSIETAHGRMRKLKWAARTLDLDILVYGDLQLQDSKLCIPHAQLHERNFVLYPLRDIAPDMLVPGLGRVSEIAERVSAAGLERWST